MQPSAYRVPESSLGEDRDQSDFYDDAYCQYNGGPGERRIVSHKTIDQKFDTYTKNGYAAKQIDRARKESMSYFFSKRVNISAMQRITTTMGRAREKNHRSEWVT